ncbi:MAG: hypothetical protein J6W16_01975 [Methanobrevibacter sp.]|nr:hypothetical protein [Methanobrevibacter sp.]
MTDSLVFDELPFKSIEQHDKVLLRSCKERAKSDDVIYHLGDLCSFKMDRGNKGLDVKPYELIKDIPATFINIRGNHDLNNKVKSVCDSMHMFLSKRYPSVSLSHYPTYDKRIDSSCLHAPIHLCGHVHKQFRHCLDLDHKILNINVGCMMWGFKIISDVELIAYLNVLFRKRPDELYRCHTENGKLIFIGNNSF